jgi:hypothetical protein
MLGRTRLVLGAMLGAALIAVAPALGITFGQPDEDRHPYVGALIVKLDDGTLIPWCSGTMVGEKAFLTAAHCTFFAELIFGPGNYELGATFVTDLGLDDAAPAFDESDVVMGTGYTHPSFDGKVSANAKRVDIAVVMLDDDPGVGRATLPTAGLLETIDLQQASFTAVGYGVGRDDKRHGPQSLFDDGLRRYSEQTATQFNRSWLLLSMNPATGDGGTCYGDSGGPHFLGTGAAATTVVSVTSWGDRYCRSTDWTARVDTPEALSFIEEVIR